MRPAILVFLKDTGYLRPRSDPWSFLIELSSSLMGHLMLRKISLFLACAGMTIGVSASAQVSAPASPVPATTGGIADIGYMTAKQLAERCSQNDSAGSSYCFAYIAAVTDTARAYEIWLGAREFCLPAKIAQSEIRRAFMTYVSAYPVQSSGQAASVVVNALKLTYPCE